MGKTLVAEMRAEAEACKKRWAADDAQKLLERGANRIAALTVPRPLKRANLQGKALENQMMAHAKRDAKRKRKAKKRAKQRMKR